MNKDEIFAQVTAILTEQFEVNAEIEMSSHFVEDLNLDSLDLVELVMTLEEKLGKEISDEEAEGLKTVGDVVRFIEDKAG